MIIHYYYKIILDNTYYYMIIMTYGVWAYKVNFSVFSYTITDNSHGQYDRI